MTSATDPRRSTGSDSHRPPGSHSIVAYLLVGDARAAIDFYRDVFGATVTYEPITMDDGRIGHTELTIGDSTFMMADEFPEIGMVSPHTLGGSPIVLNVYVADVDATFSRALELGATVERDVADQFHGTRSGTVVDPFGHRWTIGTWLGGGGT